MIDYNDLSKPSQRNYGRYSKHNGDDSRCAAKVSDGMRFPNYVQCHNKNGHGPESLYCKIHSPETAVKRQQKSDEKFQARMKQWRLEFAGGKYHEWARKMLAKSPIGPEWEELKFIYNGVERDD